jgi:hypothetical protein
LLLLPLLLAGILAAPGNQKATGCYKSKGKNMNRRSIAVPLTVLFVLAVAEAAMAADPFVGAWRANMAKSSKTTNPSQSDIAKIEAIENGIKTTRDVLHADGKVSHSESIYKFDGKAYPYPSTSHPGAVAACTRIDDSRFTCVIKADGKEIARLLDVISSDGRTGTLIFMGRNSQGQDSLNTLVYEKQ